MTKNPSTYVLFPEISVKKPLSTGSYISLCVFGIVILLGIAGSVITSISTPKGLFVKTVAAFSFTDNVKKLFTISSSGD